MDGQRFDRLTRALAKSGSRRDAMRALLGLSGAAVGAIAVEPSANARTTGSRPRIPTPAPPPTCPSGAPLCGGACCPDGQSCCNGACCAGVCTNGICCPTGTVHCAGGCCAAGAICCEFICCQPGEQCSASGRRCCPAGTDVCGEDCCGAGQSCCGGECCDGDCYGEELCCPIGSVFCEASGVCCEPGQQCCGADGCCWGTCVGAGQLCCADASGEVCSDTCCDVATQDCCVGFDSSLSCIDKGVCCPGPGGCCVNNGVGQVCADSCCDPASEECCEGIDGTLSCIERGVCCPGAGGCCVNNGVGQVCADLCCDPANEECCEGIDGTLSCIAIGVCCPGLGGCCLDLDCGGEGDCAATCNLVSHRCEFPGSDVTCGEPTCSPENAAALSFVCDGAGACATNSHDCSPFVCSEAQCLTSCSDATSCLSEVCNADMTCCAVDDTCFDEVCCPADPEHPGINCCPDGSGCCECFPNSRASSGAFCCAGPRFEICPSADGDWRNDTCMDTSRYRCVNNTIRYHEWVCDNDDVCSVPCCGGEELNAGPGGTCCATGTECSAGQCVAVSRECTTMSDGSVVGCAVGERCTTETACSGGEGCVTSGTCCPGHRWYVPDVGEDLGYEYIACCSSGQESGAACLGHPYCHSVPDVSCTSLYSFTRR